MNDKKKLGAFARRHGGTVAVAAVAAITLLAPELAWAGSAQGLPYEAPLERLVNSLTGPVAMGISLIGVVVSGAMLVWGGELGDFAKTILRLVLAVAIIMGASGLVRNFMGANGAVISAAAPASAAAPGQLTTPTLAVA